MRKLLFFLFFITGMANAQPPIAQSSNMSGCPNIYGFIPFDLTQNNYQILNGLAPSLYTVLFFESLAYSQNNSNAITNPSNYVYFPSNQPHTIYVRVFENSNPNNYSLTNFDLISNSPNIVQPPSLYSYNGNSVFNLTSCNTVILNGITPSSVEISYYNSLYDAQNGLNAISNPTSFSSSYSPQTIYVKVMNYVTGCQSTTTFDVIVSGLDDIVFIPDLNFKAKLLSANTTNFTAVGEYYYSPAITCSSNDIGYTTPSINIDVNNDGEIQVSEAQMVRQLYISYCNPSINDLTGIEAFSNLQYLSLSNNNVSSLNLSQNQMLIGLDCSNNPLTNLNFSLNHPLLELSCYNLPIANLDFSQYPNLRSLSCGWQNMTNLNINQNPDLLGLAIQNGQLNTLSISQNNLLKSLYLYNLPLTSLDVSQNYYLLNFSLHNTQVSNLNLALNNQLCTFSSHDNPISSLDFSQVPSLTYLECVNNPNLSFVSVKNGTSLYGGFSIGYFNNNPNLTYVCADDFEMSSIQSLVGSNATVNSYCTFTAGGNYNTITGNVKFDSNGNGCDGLDVSEPNIRLTNVNGPNQGTTFTNSNGNYAFFVQQGNNVLTPTCENASWFNFSPSSVTIPFANNSNNSFNQDFCITANGVHNDLEIEIVPISPAIVGHDSYYVLVIKNKGNQILSGDVSFTYNEDVVDFVSCNSSVIPTPGNLNFVFNNLLPFQSRNITLVLNLNSPIDTPALNNGDLLNFTATINPIANDENSADNTFAYYQTMVGSFDPNNKTCLEGNVVSTSKIGDYLHYNINFENTGTSQAENIVVKDMIDVSKFDINTLQILDSSHPMITRINGNKVEFIFENINLGANQHGNVTFKIKTKSTLITGNTVTNNANIYFDYNAPIVTNTASTTFQALNNGQFVIDNSILVSPNPTKGNVVVISESLVKSIQLYDVQGRLLETKLTNDTNEIIDISEKSNGIYFLKITSELGSKVEKIVKK